MLKEKWQKMLLREKILLISGILAILSIPLALVALCIPVIPMTFFIITFFYNLIE